MKRIFILYVQDDLGTTTYIHESLLGVFNYAKKHLLELDQEEFNKLWVNQYDIDEVPESVAFNEVFDAFANGREPNDLSEFLRN